MGSSFDRAARALCDTGSRVGGRDHRRGRNDHDRRRRRRRLESRRPEGHRFRPHHRPDDSGSRRWRTGPPGHVDARSNAHAERNATESVDDLEERRCGIAGDHRDDSLRRSVSDRRRRPARLAPLLQRRGGGLDARQRRCDRPCGRALHKQLDHSAFLGRGAGHQHSRRSAGRLRHLGVSRLRPRRERDVEPSRRDLHARCGGRAALAGKSRHRRQRTSGRRLQSRRQVRLSHEQERRLRRDRGAERRRKVRQRPTRYRR